MQNFHSKKKSSMFSFMYSLRLAQQILIYIH